MENPYQPPLDKFLTLGEPPRGDTQIDYSTYGISHQHVPELIQMALDEVLHTGPADSSSIWAPLHAWSALAQLRAEEATVPLLKLLRRIDENDDDFVSEQLPDVFAKFGPAAINPLVAYLANQTHGKWARVAATDAIGKIGEQHPTARVECITHLANQLRRFAGQSDIINGSIVSSLLNLKAVEVAPLIEKAFAAGAVDEMHVGNWNDVQIELGLKAERGFPYDEDIEIFAQVEPLEKKKAKPEDPRQQQLFSSPTSSNVVSTKANRNDPCPCGSGKRYKKCCGKQIDVAPRIRANHGTKSKCKVTLKRDQSLGCFLNVPAVHVEKFRLYLMMYDVRFALNPDQAAQLSEPNHSTFVFGAQHPLGIQERFLNYDFEVEIDPLIVLTETTYTSPVNKLLILDEPLLPGQPAMEFSSYGIVYEHVPELIRMALDRELHTGPDSSPIIWAPIHALWALAQLRAEEAIVPLLELFQSTNEFADTWIVSELPFVFGEFGPAAIGPLATYLADASREEFARAEAAESLAKIGQYHPSVRAECVTHISRQMDRFLEHSGIMNGLIVSSLLELNAVEAASNMEKAFAAGAVEEGTAGDWEEVQVQLGLKERSEVPRETEILENVWTPPPPIPAPVPYVAPPKAGRNDPCPCGSGKKYKKCCLK
jgi:uncharacterized protein YecA (UPF0149 family)